jgi:hypothetical protein
MSDDDIIRQRIAGSSVRAIAKAQSTSVSAINEAIYSWAESAIDDKLRKHPLALGLARLDEVEETFYAHTLGGDVSCGALVILERRCVMLSLHTPQTAVLQIVEEAGPKETSTYRIERAPISQPGRTTIPPLTKCRCSRPDARVPAPTASVR